MGPGLRRDDGDALSDRVCADMPLHIFDINRIADDNRRALDRLLAEPLARDELAFVETEPVHEALAVADDDVLALHGRRAEPAVLELILLPEARAGVLVVRPDVAVGVGDHDRGVADRGAA